MVRCLIKKPQGTSHLDGCPCPGAGLASNYIRPDDTVDTRAENLPIPQRCSQLKGSPGTAVMGKRNLTGVVCGPDFYREKLPTKALRLPLTRQVTPRSFPLYSSTSAIAGIAWTVDASGE